MRIAMLAYTRYPTDARVRRQAEALAERGDDVTCFCLRSAGPSAGDSRKGVRVIEVPVSRYRGGSFLVYMSSYCVFMIVAGAALLAAHVRRRFDVIHVHTLPDFMVLAALPARLLGARVILDIHDTTPESYATKFGLPMRHPVIRALGLVERLSAALAHRVIAVHEPQKAALVSRGHPAARIDVVLNSPDESLFAPNPERPLENDGMFHVFYHGMVTPRHGVDLLVRAVIDLSRSIGSLRLTVCGEGDSLEALRRQVDLAGARDRITFTGLLPLEAMAGLLASADLEVIPLRGSPAADLMLPVKALEAIACGVPVAAADCMTLKHYFADGAVRFFRPDDAGAIREVIREAHEDREGLRRRTRRASEILSCLAWSRQKTQYFRSIDGLAGARRCSIRIAAAGGEDGHTAGRS